MKNCLTHLKLTYKKCYRLALEPFENWKGINYFWVRDRNGNNEEYCLVYNKEEKKIIATSCSLPYNVAVVCEELIN